MTGRRERLRALGLRLVRSTLTGRRAGVIPVALFGAALGAGIFVFTAVACGRFHVFALTALGACLGLAACQRALGRRGGYQAGEEVSDA